MDDQLSKTLPDAVSELRRALGEWLRQFNSARPAPWPEIELATTLQSLTADANKLAQELNSAETAEALWAALRSAGRLLDNLKRGLFGTVRDDAVNAALSASAAARESGANADAIDQAAAKLPDGAIAGGETAIKEFTNGLNTLRGAMVEALTAAWNDTTHPLPGLGEGKFTIAVDALRRKHKAPPPVPHLFAKVAKVPARSTAVIPPRWKVILEAAAAKVAEPVNVRARLIVPLGSDQPDVTLSWFKAGVPVGRSAPGTFERSFSFTEPGSVPVSVEAVDKDGITDSATIILHVSAQHGALVVPSVQDTLAKVEHIQNFAAGAIVTVAGWFIFSPTFTGTLPEFFAAFLWGFTADIGLAKVRELAESLKALKVPVPILKQ